MAGSDQERDWNPGLYLKFRNERTQPSIDLVSRIKIDNPGTIIDIGCGPGNSTQILRERWPGSRITGLDSSPEMIRKAADEYTDMDWILSDVSGIDDEAEYDIVFSNAAIQWMPDHLSLMKKLFSITAKNGAVAVQVPMFSSMPLGKAIEDTAAGIKWRELTAGCRELFTYHDCSFYYDELSRYSDRIDMWETTYFHVMDSAEAILEWIRSTGLRPYLDKLVNDKMKNGFELDILEKIRKVYPLQRNGKVLFPFIRLFFVAYT